MNKNLNNEINQIKQEKDKLNIKVKQLSAQKNNNNINNRTNENVRTTIIKQEHSAELLEKDLTISKNNRLISELNGRITNLLKQNKDKEELIKKINIEKENDNKKFKEKLKMKDENINNLNEKIKKLSKTQIIEHRTIVQDDEFNSLVDENEELKTVNNDLVEKLNFLIRQRQDKNYYSNDSIINQQKEEINNLNKKYNQLYYELNQYKDKNNELNRQIKNLKNGMK